MNEETKLIEKLRNLGEEPHMPNEEKFLKSLRIKLSDHIAAHSATGGKTKIPWHAKGTALFDYLRSAVANNIALPGKAIGAIIIICILGASGAAIASQNSLPGETLYPIKILGEEVRSSLALTPESKVKMQSEFTAKRVMEVKTIIEQDEVDQEILDIALDNLHKNTASTAAIIDEEGQKGADVAELAKNTSIDLNKNKEDLKQIFQDKNAKLIEEEDKLKNKIEEAKKNDDQTSVTSLNTELDKTNNKRKSLESSWHKNEEMLDENNHKIKKQTEKKRSDGQDKKQERYNDPKKENGKEDDKKEEATSRPDDEEKNGNSAKERKE